MLIVGAKGFAKEVLEILRQQNDLRGLVFFDDINSAPLLYDQFPILKNEDEVKKHFQAFGNQFTLGVGNSTLRHKLYQKFTDWNGEFTTTISPFAKIGSYDVQIGAGTNILTGAIFSNSTTMGMGGIVYYNVIVTHDCTIGDFVELSPNAQLLGRCKIGDFTQIGANSVILPDVDVGSNVIIGAGSVVTKNIPSNCIAVGTPAKIIRFVAPLDYNNSNKKTIK